MKWYDYSQKTILEVDKIPEHFQPGKELFILCRTDEVFSLRKLFGFDESTVLDRADLDESVRYASFDGYDFLSMVSIEVVDQAFHSREINLYVSSRYLVLVIPAHESTRLTAFENKMLDFARLMMDRTERINRLYYWTLHTMLVDFSDTLEKLEDRMQAMLEDIIVKVDKVQFTEINTFRNMAYAIKKQLRAMTYLGEQILIDENKFIDKNQIHQFKSIATRIKKIHDFAESLYNLASEMLYTYDSRLTMKTNDTVNKLTIVTLFYGPLTVITGIYGMNFDYMPELHWTFGYPMALALMGVVSVSLFFLLKKIRWIQ